MSIGILDCLKRERDINVKSKLSGAKTVFGLSPALIILALTLFHCAELPL